jgi:aarF domain-containing kinase
MTCLPHLAGLFIKIGQVLSSRPDFIPPIYVECFSTLQDEAPGWPGLQSRAIIEHSLKTVHGLTFEEVFASFEDKPIGSASIGQVHSATLSQEFLKIARKGGYAGGETIAIKVMHLDAKDRFRNDLKIFKWLCRVTLPGWGSMLREFEKQIMTEFDYALEASNLSVIRKNMMNSPFKNRVVVPQPIEEFTTSNVLLMEMLDGEKLLDSMQERLSSILNGDEDLVKTILKEKKRSE